jgi:nitroreductase
MVRQVSNADVRVSVHKSAALAAMTFMYAMKAEGYDTCPMEGFDSLRVKKLIGLPSGAEINMIIGCGKGLPEGVYGKRFRVQNEKVIFER